MKTDLYSRVLLAPADLPGADGGAPSGSAAPVSEGAPADNSAEYAEVLYGDTQPSAGDKPAGENASDKDAAPASKAEGTKDVTSKSPLDEDEDDPIAEEDKAKGEGDKQPEGEATFKPEEIKLPEGMALDKAAMDEFAPVFNELKMGNEQAQKLVDKYIALQQRQQAEYEATQVEWKKSAMLDPEIGKGNWTETKVMARKAVEAFGSPSLRELLTVSGLSTHPEMLRFLRRAGATAMEDRPVKSEVAAAPKQDAVEILYGKGK